MNPRFHEIRSKPRADRGASGVPALEARLPQFLGAPADAVERLLALKVLLIGCGSVGRNIALHLARFVCQLWLVDRGRLKAESLLTHPIVPADVGARKATNLGRACKRLQPRMRVFAYDADVADLPALDGWAEADVAVLATDNLLAEVEVNQRCLRLGLPLLQAAVHGDSLVAQVRFLANRGGQGACLVCGFSQAEWGYLNAQTTFSCEGLARGETMPRVAVQPTMSTSFLCSLAADMAVTQLVRFALKLGQPVDDTAVEQCGYTHRAVVSPLAANPACPCDHTVYERARSPRPLAECSLGELAAAGGLGDGPAAAGLGFTVGDGLVFAEQGGCGCGPMRPIGRFVRGGASVGRCAACRSAIQAHPYFCHRVAPRSVLQPVLTRRLGDLGAGDARWVAIRADDKAVLFQPPLGDRPTT